MYYDLFLNRLCLQYPCCFGAQCLICVCWKTRCFSAEVVLRYRVITTPESVVGERKSDVTVITSVVILLYEFTQPFVNLCISLSSVFIICPFTALSNLSLVLSVIPQVCYLLLWNIWLASLLYNILCIMLSVSCAKGAFRLTRVWCLITQVTNRIKQHVIAQFFYILTEMFFETAW